MKLFIGILTLCLTQFAFSQDIKIYYSSFTVMGQSLQMKMEIRSKANLHEIYLSDIKDKTFTDKLVETKFYSNDSLAFEWAQIALKFKGKFNLKKDSIVGKMSQGIEWDVAFTSALGREIKINRPQEESLKWDGEQKNVKIKNGKIELGATLYLPKNFNENTKIIVFASGSGPQNRHEEILGHKPFLVLANYFASQGIASLCFDDRGIGESTGSFGEATLEDFASDVNACINFLHKNKLTKKNKLGILGHSEGGMHAMMVAKENQNVSFLLLLATVGTSGKEVLVQQQYTIPHASGSSIEMSKWNEELFRLASDISIRNIEVKQNLIKMIDSMYNIAPDQKDLDTASLHGSLIGMLNTTWARQFLTFKTVDYLSKFNGPVLAINNEKDIQVDALTNSMGIEKSLSESSRKVSKVAIQKGLNHLFQHCDTCDFMEYGSIEETFDVNTMKMMVDWINKLSL